VLVDGAARNNQDPHASGDLHLSPLPYGIREPEGPPSGTNDWISASGRHRRWPVSPVLTRAGGHHNALYREVLRRSANVQWMALPARWE